AFSGKIEWMRTEGMSPLLALGLLVAGLCSSVHCLPGGGLHLEDVTPEDQHKGAPVDGHTFVSSNTDFAFSLYKHLYKQLALKTPNENVIFCPLSISMALAFLSLGAHGPTLMEILEGLKFNLTKTPETEIHQGFQHLLQMLGRPSNQLQLSVGNAMFVQEQLKLLHKFREDAWALCDSKAFSTDFRGSDTAKKLINDYVRNKTQGKIVEFFKDLDKLTNIVLVNYIFFKGFRAISVLAQTTVWIDELNLPMFSISSDYELRNILSQLGIKKVFNHESDLTGIIEANKLGVSE
ncbi:hypothetical protein E2I00_001024, partial [Balaenoptera physalus]